MDIAAFEKKLKSEGYVEIETKEYTPRPRNDKHGHDFGVCGLVLAGAFTVTQDERAVTYLPGQIFTVAGGHPHHEEVGPDGARILVGRKY